MSAENLENLGAARLAELLVAFAEHRPDLKRQLRMELAAEQGAEHLVAEIDKRLASLAASRTKVSWRKRASFIADFDVLRALIVERLARLDAVVALDRLWLFLDLDRRLATRVKDRDGTLADLFRRAAADVGGLVAARRDAAALAALADAVARHPVAWEGWLPAAVAALTKPQISGLLARLQMRDLSGPAGVDILRRLADAAGDIEAYAATVSKADLATPAGAAQLAHRLLLAGRTEDAGAVLSAARPASAAVQSRLRTRNAPPLDAAWESTWIAYLEQAGQGEAAQTARWESFERTLSIDHARAFVQQLGGFDDVEADARARAYAAAYPDVAAGLRFLMDWPALPEAAAMILNRGGAVDVDPVDAELWAGRLRSRHPKAAHDLLRKAAALAFRRREFATCDRLTQEADSIPLD